MNNPKTSRASYCGCALIEQLSAERFSRQRFVPDREETCQMEAIVARSPLRDTRPLRNMLFRYRSCTASRYQSISTVTEQGVCVFPNRFVVGKYELQKKNSA